jgi:hypothetical protein
MKISVSSFRGKGQPNEHRKEHPSGYVTVSPFLHVLLYFVSIGALLALFGSVATIFVWLLLKLRRLAVRLLGGTIRE